jgi:hypothetical protein
MAGEGHLCTPQTGRGIERKKGSAGKRKKIFANGQLNVTFAAPRGGRQGERISSHAQKSEIRPLGQDISGEPRGEPTKFFKR